MRAYKVAIVRLSSLGDVVVSASLLANARALYPQVSIDWIVDSSFSAVLESSLSIDRLIAIPLKKGGLRAICGIMRQLRGLGQYDMVIDMQGLIKSAIVARMVKARAYWGFRQDSIKEPLASVFYTHKVEIAYSEHILKRNAKLLLSALAWLTESSVDSVADSSADSRVENRGDLRADSAVESRVHLGADSKAVAQGAQGLQWREALESSVLWELCSRRAEVFGASEGAHRRAEEILTPLRLHAALESDCVDSHSRRVQGAGARASQNAQDSRFSSAQGEWGRESLAQEFAGMQGSESRAQDSAPASPALAQETRESTHKAPQGALDSPLANTPTQSALEGKVIVLILEASLESKAYPVGLCVELVRLLVGANVLLLGHTSSKAREIKAHFANEARVCELPALSLDEVKALLMRADLVIGGDTGITHLAWALGRDSITLYGNTPPARFALRGEKGGNRALCGSENPRYDKNDFSIRNITPRAICECAQTIVGGRELC